MPYCTRCGSEVSAHESYCSNCGQPTAAAPAAPVTVVEAPPQQQRVEPLAIAALIVGVASFFQAPVPVVTNIVAIVLGTHARARIRENRELTGEGLAMAGIVIAIVGLVIGALLVIAMLLFFSEILNG